MIGILINLICREGNLSKARNVIVKEQQPFDFSGEGMDGWYFVV